jgi:hypothetical protein
MTAHSTGRSVAAGAGLGQLTVSGNGASRISRCKKKMRSLGSRARFGRSLAGAGGPHWANAAWRR